MKTEQEIRDTIKALREDLVQIEREAFESMRKREALEQGPAALVREFVEVQSAIREHLKAHPEPSAEQPEGVMRAWSELLNRDYLIRQRMHKWVDATQDEPAEAAE